MADLNADDSILPCNQITQIHMFDGGPDIKVRVKKWRNIIKQDHGERIFYYY